MTWDAIVVGAGPIGLECAVRLQQRGRTVLVLDRGAVGQTITWFPRQMHFFSSNDRIAICGVPLQTLDQQKATREEYLAYLRQVVRIFDLPVRTFTSVTDVVREEQGFAVHCVPHAQGTSDPGRAGAAGAAGAGGAADAAGPAGPAGEVLRARSVVLAIGDMDAPRRLGIPGEELPHVGHYFEEPHRYFGRRLLIVGGKNSAVEAALRCHHAGAQVALSYRRVRFDASSVKYWLLPELQSRIERGEIGGHLGTVPVAIEPDAVSLEHVGSGEISVVPADDVLLLTGYVADTTLFRRCGIELEEPDGIPVYDPDTMQTAIPGLYVAGTATAGTQAQFGVFLENCHVHAERIAAHVAGDAAPAGETGFELPET